MHCFTIEQHKVIKSRKIRNFLVLLYKESETMWILIKFENTNIIDSKCYFFGTVKKVSRITEHTARSDYTKMIKEL